MFGPAATFLGVRAASLDDPRSFGDADVVIIGAPFDGGASHRSGSRLGPHAIRTTDYLEHGGARPSFLSHADPFSELRIVDLGDVLMPPGDMAIALRRLEEAVTTVAATGAVPVVLGGDHSIALPDVTGVARHHGFGNVALIQFDAHADTAESQFGLAHGHSTSMRRLVESGAVRGDRLLQIGLRGYWPGSSIRGWMTGQGIRSFDMARIVRYGLDDCLDEAFAIATQDVAGVFLSVDLDVVDPGMAPGTGTPEPGGLTSRELLYALRRCTAELPVIGVDVVELSPPYDGPGEITAFLANRIVLECLAGIAARHAGDVG